MKKYLFLISILLFIIITNSCKKSNNPGKTRWNLPYFGFNAKGNMEVAEQTSYANSYFSQIPADIKKNLVVRVTGGKVSQTTFNDDWTDENIGTWVLLQQTQGLRLIFVVNGNDTPINQKNLIQRWINAGARFDFIEMMNEYYLLKYALGDTSNPEVTESVSPQKYVDTILPNFWSQLDVFNLPYYVILAPTTTGNLQTYYNAWNDTLINAIYNKYASRKLNATLHCYIQGAGMDFNYNQISYLKSILPASSHLAITEAGIIDSTINYQQSGTFAIEHYKKIIDRLTTGDYLLDQVLYNTSQNNNTANLNPEYNGVTPKGALMLPFINNWLQ